MYGTESLYERFLLSTGVTTDSRKVPEGSMFFALKGENFNGNAYAAEALAIGASYAVVDDPAVASDPRFLLVPDTLVALQDLARHHRRQFDIPVIGITGSNGKTTTKELVRDVLATTFRTYATVGNLNNHIGVPLTLLSMPRDTEMAVIEMGANHQGEIAQLAAIAEPTHGLITNIGKAHLEGFGGVEGIKKGKSELYLFLAQHEGTVFMNADQPFLSDLADGRGVRHRIRYGRSGGKGLETELRLVAADPFLKVEWPLGDRVWLLSTQLYGEYNFDNVSTAAAVGQHFGVPPERVKQALEAYLPENNRSQLKPWRGATLIMDAYNANPTSMAHALDSFDKRSEENKAVLLGHMLELGADSHQEHQTLADRTAGMRLRWRVFVGTEFSKVRLPEGAQYFPDATAAKEWIDRQNVTDYCVLAKGSRGNRLEIIFS
jgi:UDP-N-acetylmuramoyl-tripeptide--D-alanyl-D-alanine ligase